IRNPQSAIRNSSRLRLLRLFSLGGSLLLALLVTEIGLRAFNYRPGTMDPDMYVANQNQLLPYRLRPNYKGYCAGREVETDAEGNRLVSPSYAALRQSQTSERQVLLLGDSGVFGFGLGDEDTIASQMQRAAVAKSLNYDIRNIGVSGYTSWNEYEALKDYLSRHSATNVVVLYMPNDLTLDNDYFGIAKGKRASFDRGEHRRHDFTRWLYSHLYISFLISDSTKRLTSGLSSITPNPQPGGIFDEEGKQAELNYSMQALQQIQELCDQKQIDFQVGIYRDVAYLDDASTWLSYEDMIKKHLDRKGIKWFIAKSHIDRLKANEIRVAWNDPHPSAKAAGLIADDVLSAVR
ncbi:MAG: SGNH/GDSL hydrolase family protein, partial [Pyrinomonadaceae bacterium]